jgi:hypothetical protein
MSSSLMWRLKASLGNTNANTIDPPASIAQAEEDTTMAPAAEVMDHPLSYTNVSHHDDFGEGVLVVPPADEENKDTSSDLSLSPNQLSDSVLEDLKMGSKTDLDLSVLSQPHETVGSDSIPSYRAESEEDAVLVDEPFLSKEPFLVEKNEEADVVDKTEDVAVKAQVVDKTEDVDVKAQVVFKPFVETVYTPEGSWDSLEQFVQKEEDTEANRTCEFEAFKKQFSENIFRPKATTVDTEAKIFASAGDLSTGTMEEKDVFKTLMWQWGFLTVAAGFLIIAGLACVPANVPIPMEVPTPTPVRMFMPPQVPTYTMEQLGLFVEDKVETVKTVKTTVRATRPTPTPTPVVRAPTVVPTRRMAKPVAFVDEKNDKNKTSASGTFYSTSLFLGVLCVFLLGQVSEPKTPSEDGDNQNPFMAMDGVKTEWNDMFSLNSVEGMLAFHQTFFKSGKGRRIFMDSRLGLEAYEELSCIELFLILDGFGRYSKRSASKSVLIRDLASKYEKALKRFTCPDIKEILSVKGYTAHAHMPKKELIALAVQAAF